MQIWRPRGFWLNYTAAIISLHYDSNDAAVYTAVHWFNSSKNTWSILKPKNNSYQETYYNIKI